MGCNAPVAASWWPSPHHERNIYSIHNTRSLSLKRGSRESKLTPTRGPTCVERVAGRFWAESVYLHLSHRMQFFLHSHTDFSHSTSDGYICTKRDGAARSWPIDMLCRSPPVPKQGRKKISTLAHTKLSPPRRSDKTLLGAALSILIAFCLFYARKKLISSCVRCDGLAAGCFLWRLLW